VWWLDMGGDCPAEHQISELNSSTRHLGGAKPYEGPLTDVTGQYFSEHHKFSGLATAAFFLPAPCLPCDQVD